MTNHPHSQSGSKTDRTEATDQTDVPDSADLELRIADAADLPADATVLIMPRGSFYHLPMGESKLPLCDASSVPITRITAHTRYHAAVEEKLEPCMKCLKSADAVTESSAETPPAAD